MSEKELETKELEAKAEEPGTVDEDFTDNAPNAPEEAEKPVVEEETTTAAEPSVNMNREDAIEPSKEQVKGSESYDYSESDLLESIEAGRADFYAFYRKRMHIKWAVTAVCLVLILAGWIIPSFIPYFQEGGAGSGAGIYVTLAVTAVAVVLLAVIMILSKRKVDAGVKNHIALYYQNSDTYVFHGLVDQRNGNVDSKLPDQLFADSGLYNDVVKVGSRNCLTFNYKGHEAVFADCAASISGQKQLQTVFIGKYMVIENSYKGPEVLIYRKGNKRALPPTNLKGRDVFEDSKDMVIYGPKESKKLLAKKVRDALSSFITNATFVDMSVVVKEGKTYFALGYEDDLMVLPMEKAFNPNPTKVLRHNIECVFGLVDAIEGRTN